MRRFPCRQLVLVLLLGIAAAAFCEDGRNAWLRYARVDPAIAARFVRVPNHLVVLGDTPMMHSAKMELLRGLRGMLGRTVAERDSPESASAVVVGSRDRVAAAFPDLPLPSLSADAYFLTWYGYKGQELLIVAGGDDRGALYGAFALLSKIARGEYIRVLNERQAPAAPLRWVNQWDNLDGSIERGYAGRSIFFDDGRVRSDLTRASEYARLLASIGVNGCVVNNVNADPRVLDPEFLPRLARLADVFRPYGVRIGLGVNLAMPKLSGDLDTFDPLDPRVQNWWKRKFDAIYRVIPDLGGVVVKADSEGQLGPSAYGRDAAQAANVMARAIAPHYGVVFYRAFVYNHHLDWNDMKADRARAAYDIFHPLDGQFDENVIVQIKNGPIDFQVREPASPLFGGLSHTNKAIELQITQEYTGQQRHTVYLAPMWKQTLDFELGANDPVKSVLHGFVGVSNVGLDNDWLGNHLAMANLYAFGRLAWNPNDTAEEIVDEWSRLTFGNDPAVVNTIDKIQMNSWPAYEHYTGPLGLQSLTNILGPHYGPAPESQERNGWGQWIRADHDGVGMDRTMATGTGFVGQYPPVIRGEFESAAATSDEFLLFLHHVPYTYRLHTGKTVIQAIYDFHYEGAERAQLFADGWKTLQGKTDPERFEDVLAQLTYQADHAVVWRDAINDWFLKLSGIPDNAGRVGQYPGRFEAEAMNLSGYCPIELASWEGASGGKAVSCAEKMCSAEMQFDEADGMYDLGIEYFDLQAGAASFRVYLNQQLIDTWTADQQLPGTVLSADVSLRRHLHAIKLRRGDTLRIEGMPSGMDPAALDYVEISARSLMR